MTNPHGNLIEDEFIPREDKIYLGDGLYGVFVGDGFYLQAYDGLQVQQSVWLEDTSLAALVRFAKEKGLLP